MKKIKVIKANLINNESLLQSAMELLQIATAKFIIKCDKVYCELRHMLQTAPGGGGQ